MSKRWWAALGVSLLILVPCFWHPRIEAGDLASHVYNAWLTNLIPRGQAPGLYLAAQTNNILVDLLLSSLGGKFGFPFAEKAVVSFCVLVFFWGAFALVAAVAKREPWYLVPALAMGAYGYTFEMGFLNFYLSLGFVFVALAIAYHGSNREWVAIVPLGVLAWMSHPVGFILLAGVAVYAILGRKLTGWPRRALFIAALLAVVAAHLYVFRLRTELWSPFTFYLRNGADQIALFGKRYMFLFAALSTFLACALGYGFYQEHKDLRRRIRIALELWVVLLFTVAMMPQTIYLPKYPAPAAFFVSRITGVSLVLMLCILGSMRRRLWHAVGLAVCAGIFFTWLYQDTGELNGIEAKAEDLVRTLPYGSRVIPTLGPHAGSRILFISHLVDRACVGHCFVFNDYEPSTEQFRLRVRPGSRIATSSADDATRMATGQYTVQASDLPLHEIYQCDSSNVDKLCLKQLAAGKKNCEECASSARPITNR